MTSEPLESSALAPVDRKAVAQGTLLGLSVIAPALMARVALNAMFGDGSNKPAGLLFLLILAGYVVAGHRTVTRARRDPLRHGAVVGLATVLVWLPPWIVLTNIFGGGAKGDLIAGVFGHTVFALTFAMIGGLAGMRRVNYGRAGTKILPTETKTQPTKEP